MFWLPSLKGRRVLLWHYTDYSPCAYLARALMRWDRARLVLWAEESDGFKVYSFIIE